MVHSPNILLLEALAKAMIPICIQVVIPECFYRGYGSQQNRIPD
jgi:hypothetical protein